MFGSTFFQRQHNKDPKTFNHEIYSILSGRFSLLTGRTCFGTFSIFESRIDTWKTNSLRRPLCFVCCVILMFIAFLYVDFGLCMNMCLIWVTIRMIWDGMSRTNTHTHESVLGKRELAIRRKDAIPKSSLSVSRRKSKHSIYAMDKECNATRLKFCYFTGKDMSVLWKHRK